jgi:hypothetical protein
MDQYLTCAQSHPWGSRACLISDMRRHPDFLEKSDEREFLFGLQCCADPELLIWVVGVEWDFLIISLLLLLLLHDRQLIGGLLVGC